MELDVQKIYEEKHLLKEKEGAQIGKRQLSDYYADLTKSLPVHSELLSKDDSLMKPSIGQKQLSLYCCLAQSMAWDPLSSKAEEEVKELTARDQRLTIFLPAEQIIFSSKGN